MLKLAFAACLCLTTASAFCQSVPGYEVATILDVKTHQGPATTAPDAPGYDVSVQVGDKIYVVLYVPPFGLDIVKHKTGSNLLVHVEKDTISYNDILGRSIEVPIISQRPAIATAQAK